jgi:replication factor C subunit 3/5
VNKIIPAIQSRCTKFRFQPLPSIEVEKRLDVVIEEEKCNVTASGKEALLKLSKGDMRRALNVLQACHVAYDSVDEDAVYNCVGNPHPVDIERILESMMSESFSTSLSTITTIKTQKGLALQDILGGILESTESLELPSNTRVYMLDQLAVIE